MLPALSEISLCSLALVCSLDDYCTRFAYIQERSVDMSIIESFAVFRVVVFGRSGGLHFVFFVDILFGALRPRRSSVK